MVVTKNQYRGEDFLKKGGGTWTVCKFKRGGGGMDSKRGVVFLKERMHAMNFHWACM